MIPDLKTLYTAIDATWPAHTCTDTGAWIIRKGQGGGKRVSAATAMSAKSVDEIPGAERAMRALGQSPLFMIQQGQDVLDQTLAAMGYEVLDLSNIYACPIGRLTQTLPPRTATFHLWEPMAIQLDIWAAGGIGPARIDVMKRAKGPKTALFGRDDNRPAATGFVAIHDGIAMVHALEVLPRHRRRGLARHMMTQAALWASANGATHMSVICTDANRGANALYSSLGMTLMGQYHYRHLRKDAPA